MHAGSSYTWKRFLLFFNWCHRCDVMGDGHRHNVFGLVVTFAEHSPGCHFQNEESARGCEPAATIAMDGGPSRDDFGEDVETLWQAGRATKAEERALRQVVLTVAREEGQKGLVALDETSIRRMYAHRDTAEGEEIAAAKQLALFLLRQLHKRVAWVRLRRAAKDDCRTSRPMLIRENSARVRAKMYIHTHGVPVAVCAAGCACVNTHSTG